MPRMLLLDHHLLIAHLRVKDTAILPPLMFLALAVAALLLRIASL